MCAAGAGDDPSTAANGVSLLATGRSVADHVLSATVDRDRALWRVFRNEPVCLDPEPAPPAGYARGPLSLLPPAPLPFRTPAPLAPSPAPVFVLPGRP